jgi:large subunit ribosomal protein L4
VARRRSCARTPSARLQPEDQQEGHEARVRARLSDKLAAGDVIVLDEFKFEAPKTKLMVKLLKELDVTRTACIVQKDVDDTVVLAASNIPTVDYSTAQALDVYTVLANRKLVCDKAGFDALMARIAK